MKRFLKLIVLPILIIIFFLVILFFWFDYTNSIPYQLNSNIKINKLDKNQTFYFTTSTNQYTSNNSNMAKNMSIFKLNSSGVSLIDNLEGEECIERCLNILEDNSFSVNSDNNFMIYKNDKISKKISRKSSVDTIDRFPHTTFNIFNKDYNSTFVERGELLKIYTNNFYYEKINKNTDISNLIQTSQFHFSQVFLNGNRLELHSFKIDEKNGKIQQLSSSNIYTNTEDIRSIEGTILSPNNKFLYILVNKEKENTLNLLRYDYSINKLVSDVIIANDFGFQLSDISYPAQAAGNLYYITYSNVKSDIISIDILNPESGEVKKYTTYTVMDLLSKNNNSISYVNNKGEIYLLERYKNTLKIYLITNSKKTTIFDSTFSNNSIYSFISK